MCEEERCKVFHPWAIFDTRKFDLLCIKSLETGLLVQENLVILEMKLEVWACWGKNKHGIGYEVLHVALH